MGEIGISDNILLKAGPLTSEEFEAMKSHVDHGGEIIAPIAGLMDATDVVQYHHEKYDGTGYMTGLSASWARAVAAISTRSSLTPSQVGHMSLSLDDGAQSS